MKTKILILGFSMVITFLSNPATAQQMAADSPSVHKESLAHTLTIPWYYPPLYETDASSNKVEEPASYDASPGNISTDTSLNTQGVKSGSENNQQEKYNNPVEYGIDEFFALKPNRF